VSRKRKRGGCKVQQRRANQTRQQPVSPEKWLAAVMASDLDQEAKAVATLIAAQAGPDGVVSIPREWLQ
jgi:hypothetical protein